MNDAVMEKLRNALLAAKNRVEQVCSGKENVIVFGTGNTAELYQKCFSLEQIKPAFYTDNNEKKWGNLYHDVKIIPPEELNKHKDMAVLICSTNYRTGEDIAEQLSRMHIPWLFTDEFVLSKHIEDIIQNSELLDEESLKVYADVIISRINNTPISCFDREQYFAIPQFTGNAEKEVFVDCGAFVGDTMEKYLFDRMGTFSKIIAIEPFKKNFDAMVLRAERLKREWALEDSQIQCVYAGVGAKSVRANIAVNDAGGLGAKVVADESGDIVIYALDDLCSNQNVGFLKADIESFELDMLHGAENIILRDHPKIAITIYHNASDLYSVFKFLRELKQNYNFAVRHHSTTWAETVLYAY